MKKTALFWIPRILGILAILFVLMFSLDVFGRDEPLTKKLPSFLMHNIPTLILTVALIVAWKWELIGGILFIALFMASCYYFRSFSGKPYSLMVTAPFLFVGILFIVNYTRMKKKES
jgi:hypothetical protein